MNFLFEEQMFHPRYIKIFVFLRNPQIMEVIYLFLLNLKFCQNKIWIFLVILLFSIRILKTCIIKLTGKICIYYQTVFFCKLPDKLASYFTQKNFQKLTIFITLEKGYIYCKYILFQTDTLWNFFLENFFEWFASDSLAIQFIIFL